MPVDVSVRLALTDQEAFLLLTLVQLGVDAYNERPTDPHLVAKIEGLPESAFAGLISKIMEAADAE